MLEKIFAFVDSFPLLSYRSVHFHVIRFSFYGLNGHQEGVNLYCYEIDPPLWLCLKRYLIGPVFLGLGKDNCVLY